MSDALVSARHLTVSFRAEGGFFGRSLRRVRAVDDVSLDVEEGSIFALVGESGCGKTTLGRALLRLLPPDSGEVFFRGKDLAQMAPEELRRQRRRMQIVFQDPYASLNPRMRIRDTLAEPFWTHEPHLSPREVEARGRELLGLVGLRGEALGHFPHQFSGGQRQRIGIARALALHPEFVVCDEAVSALDVSIQAQVLNLLVDLREKFSLTYLFITHNLAVVRHLADRVGVMFLGRIMEVGPTEELFSAPLHPYTKFLIGAVPLPDPRRRDREKLLLQGDVLSPTALPPGCRFAPRCPYARDRCREEEPRASEWEGRRVACHYPLA